MFYPEVVTAYVPIRNHPRSAAEYGKFGEQMFQNLKGSFSVKSFYEQVPQTWLHKMINDHFGGKIDHSVGDNPQKNSLDYHCIQHQKFAWLLKAALVNPSASTFIWMDYGIGHIPGVTPDVVNEFMTNVRENDFAIPGCWSKENTIINDSWPCWRFCGSMMVVPRSHLLKLYKTIKNQVFQHLTRTRNVTWEVNSLARAEVLLPEIRWYQADHNETMFTNYKLGLPDDKSESS